MKTTFALVSTLAIGLSAASAATIINNWSGVSGDKGNMVGFAVKADAGLYPASVTPLGSLTPTFQLDGLTLIRPNDTTTPSFGTGVRQTTSADTPVYVDLYSSYSGGVFSGYLGSSASSVTWSSTVADTPYTFSFAGVVLQASQKYWFVFSEDNLEGEVSNFRAKLNTSGTDATPGAGKGYLVGDIVQSVTSAGASQDWAFAYTLNITPIPEPSTAALLALSGLALMLRKRL